MERTFGSPYRTLTPDELQEVIRRAHAERAKVVAEVFGALFRLGRKRAADRPSQDHPADACPAT